MEADDEITTDDILEVLDELGVGLDDIGDLEALTKAIIELEEEPGDRSSFGHSVEVEPGPLHKFESPLRPKHRERPDALYTDQFLPFPRPFEFADGFQITADPYLDPLLSQAYDLMGRVYADIAQMDIDEKAWEERRAARRAGPRAPKDKENLPPRPPGLTRSNSYDRRANVAPRARVHRFCSTSSAPQIEDPRPAEELPRTAAELGLRPVLNPEPGRLGYRFDPVQKWKLVSEEWRRNPPVHEKKRLDLKWRVREYMLRQDEPQRDPRLPHKPILHAKAWSPRPYLD
ncbi:unnamed protein product, partial [Mesorhabditis spiculigera]